MKALNQYIQEYLISKDTQYEEFNVEEILFNFLKDPKFKLSFTVEFKNAFCGHDPNKLNHNVIPFLTKYIKKINVNHLEECYIFSMSIWNSAVTDFDDSPRWSQGEVVYYGNNTEDRYWICINKRTGDSFLLSIRKYSGYCGDPFYFKLSLN